MVRVASLIMSSISDGLKGETEYKWHYWDPPGVWSFLWHPKW